MSWTRTDWREWRRVQPHSYLLSSARSRAKTNNLPFNIDKLDIIIGECCPYLKTNWKWNTLYAPSLDRIIPELGYVKGNIEVISRKANLMKSNATPEELLEFAYTILERN